MLTRYKIKYTFFIKVIAIAEQIIAFLKLMLVNSLNITLLCISNTIYILLNFQHMYSITMHNTF